MLHPAFGGIGMTQFPSLRYCLFLSSKPGVSGIVLSVVTVLFDLFDLCLWSDLSPVSKYSAAVAAVVKRCASSVGKYWTNQLFRSVLLGHEAFAHTCCDTLSSVHELGIYTASVWQSVFQCDCTNQS